MCYNISSITKKEFFYQDFGQIDQNVAEIINYTSSKRF